MQPESRGIDLGLDPVEPALGGLLHHVEHFLETGDAAVVRIRNVLALPLAARLEEEADLAKRYDELIRQYLLNGPGAGIPPGAPSDAAKLPAAK